ncbi:MAG: hypothetical protein HY432_03655 [Candidatus Liptonbacteria bacterium]|nr:hypothetical protein [Candidatus Liptonbacteria bacterium]
MINLDDKGGKVVYPELSYRLVGISFRIQNELGRFCTEKQYANAFEKELQKENIKYKREFHIPAEIKGERAEIIG